MCHSYSFVKSIVLILNIDMTNFRTFDLNLLRVFDALLRTRNVTQSGDLLGLSQPSVSAALSRLRSHLDDPLFVRVGHKMVPTPRAEALAAPITQALQSLETALEETAIFDPATAEHVFSVQGADFLSMRLMPALAARLADEAPGVAFRYFDSGQGDLTALLERGEIDIAMEQPQETPTWVSRTLLFPSPFVVIAAHDNPAVLAAGVKGGAHLPLDLFCTLPHAIRSVDGSLSGMTDAALAKVGRKRRVMLALPHFDAIAQTVAKSRYLSVVPVQLADDLAERLALSVFQPPFEIPTPQMQIYWHARDDKVPAHQWLRREIRAEVARLWP